MSDKKKVSVVIPAYNHQQYIEEAVVSVLDQSCKVSEIIIIDDGSTDKTGSVCSRLAGKWDVIKYCRQANCGAHNALNIGIQKATGEYIAVLNSDDCFMPDKIERCLRLIRQDPSIDLISGHVSFIDSKGRIQETGTAADWQKRAYGYYASSVNLPLSILNENFVATTSNMFFTKGLWERNGGFQSLRYCHDLDFLMASQRNGKFFFDKDSTYIRYRIHPLNTIKEDLSQIRIEIAAVMAVSFALDHSKLMHPSERVLRDLKSFLNNKNLSDLSIVLLMNFLGSRDRNAFYESIFSTEAKKKFTIFLD